MAASAAEPHFLFERGFPSGVSVRLQIDGADAVERAGNFLDTYRDLYFLNDEELGFAASRVEAFERGQTVTLSQTYRGLPVFASQLVVGFLDSTLISTTGYILHGDITLDTVATLSPTQAIETARLALSLPEAQLSHPPELMIFDYSLLADVASEPHLVFLLDFVAADYPRVFIDAHTGDLVNTYGLTEETLQFNIWDALNANLTCKVSGVIKISGGFTEGPPDLFGSQTTIFPYILGNEIGSAAQNIPPERAGIVLTDYVAANDAVTKTYNFYFYKFNVDSFNGLGAKMQIYVEANLNGIIGARTPCYIAFEPDSATLDIFAHEFTHAVIASTSALVYLGESGALNESFADIMGAMVDCCDWLNGEDLPGGAIRSLSTPTDYGQPQSYLDINFTQLKNLEDDKGGVHSNSGIMNMAAFLITDGGTFDYQGEPIIGIGRDKAARFFYNSMVTFPAGANLHQAAFHMLYTVAPWTLNQQEICTVHNALYAVRLFLWPDLDCDGIEDTVDNDGDYQTLNSDNCPYLSNYDQYDLDQDGIGDDCDEDLDGDGIPDKADTAAGFLAALLNGGLDNCPYKPSPDQTDTDKDGKGNLCDPDIDNDGKLNSDDNCPLVHNPDQSDDDHISLGNACDPSYVAPPEDFDGDGVPDSVDNCSQWANSTQEDFDQDGTGDECDTDADGDNTIDTADNCLHWYNPDQADTDKDGMGNKCDPNTIPDNDKDEVLDDIDNCHGVSNTDQKNFDGDNLGDTCDPDDDNDGFKDNFVYEGDKVDNCVYFPNPDQADSDGDGIGDACEGQNDDFHIDFSIQNNPGNLASIAVSLCEPDRGTWYSQDFVMGLSLHGLEENLSAWVSGPTNPYLTMPTASDDQAHLFTPRMGEHYFLNFSFAEDVPLGESRIISLYSECGPYSEFRTQAANAPATPTLTPVVGGLTLPYLTLIQNGNCRTNPGADYELLDIVPTGFQANITGVVPDNAWLRIFLPDWNQNCWLSASVVEITGNLAGVTVYQYAPPPTPTTDPDEGNGGPPQCSDGLDNDGDGSIDGVDRECADPNDNDESS